MTQARLCVAEVDLENVVKEEAVVDEHAASSAASCEFLYDE
jgi:hypothetical protein